MVGQKKLFPKTFMCKVRTKKKSFLGMIDPTWITCEELHVTQIFKTIPFKSFTQHKNLIEFWITMIHLRRKGGNLFMKSHPMLKEEFYYKSSTLHITHRKKFTNLFVLTLHIWFHLIQPTMCNHRHNILQVEKTTQISPINVCH
jgi:hypothetical protein